MLRNALIPKMLISVLLGAVTVAADGVRGGPHAYAHQSSATHCHGSAH